MKIFIGADHRGFALKESLKSWIVSQNFEIFDCGNINLDLEDDYPLFAFSVAENVAKEKDSRGIILCGSGGGVTIAANKIAGIRAAVAVDRVDVIHNREHNDINVLAIAADTTEEEIAKDLILTFLNTSFSTQSKFERRLKEIREKEAS